MSKLATDGEDLQLINKLAEVIQRDKVLDRVLVAWGDWQDSDSRIIRQIFNRPSIISSYMAPPTKVFDDVESSDPVRARDMFPNQVYMRIEYCRKTMSPIERVVMGMKYRDQRSDGYIARKVQQLTNNDRDKLDLPRAGIKKAESLYRDHLEDLRDKVALSINWRDLVVD